MLTVLIALIDYNEWLHRNHIVLRNLFVIIIFDHEQVITIKKIYLLLSLSRVKYMAD